MSQPPPAMFQRGRVARRWRFCWMWEGTQLPWLFPLLSYFLYLTCGCGSLDVPGGDWKEWRPWRLAVMNLITWCRYRSQILKLRCSRSKDGLPSQSHGAIRWPPIHAFWGWATSRYWLERYESESEMTWSEAPKGKSQGKGKDIGSPLGSPLGSPIGAGLSFSDLSHLHKNERERSI